MRILLVGRAPRPDWRLPAGAEITVLGKDVPPADWYQAVPVADLTDLEQALSALHRSGCADFDHVYCDYEHSLVVAAALASIFDASCAVDADQAILARDKYLQKQRMAAAGIPTARVEPIPAEPADRPGYRPSFGYPVVVKPALGSAARGVHRVASEAELADLLASLPSDQPSICEEFMPGREHHLDAVIADSQIRFLSVGQYLTNVLDAEQLHIVGSRILPRLGHEQLYRLASEMIARAVQVFDCVRGVLHLEVFETDAGLAFSECALRRAGAMVPETIDLAADVDYRELACLASLGCLPELKDDSPEKAAGWMMMSAGPGRLTRLPAESDFAEITGVRSAQMRSDLIGCQLLQPKNLYDAIGRVLYASPDLPTVDRAIRAATQVYRDGVECVPGASRPEVAMSNGRSE